MSPAFHSQCVALSPGACRTAMSLVQEDFCECCGRCTCDRSLVGLGEGCYARSSRKPVLSSPKVPVAPVRDHVCTGFPWGWPGAVWRCLHFIIVMWVTGEGEGVFLRCFSSSHVPSPSSVSFFPFPPPSPLITLFLPSSLLLPPFPLLPLPPFPPPPLPLFPLPSSSSLPCAPHLLGCCLTLFSLLLFLLFPLFCFSLPPPLPSPFPL